MEWSCALTIIILFSLSRSFSLFLSLSLALLLLLFIYSFGRKTAHTKIPESPNESIQNGLLLCLKNVVNVAREAGLYTRN